MKSLFYTGKKRISPGKKTFFFHSVKKERTSLYEKSTLENEAYKRRNLIYARKPPL